MYTLRMLIDVPEGIDERRLREHLEAVARELHVDVSLENAAK
jgi:glycine cleavage system regulatory protein